MTLRARITLVATALVSMVLLVSGIALVQVQRDVLTRGVDEALLQRADNVQDQAGRLVVLPADGDPEDTFLQVVDAHGTVIAASSNVAVAPAAVPPTRRESIRTVLLRHPVDHDFRVLARPLTSDPTATLVVGKNLDDVSESVSVLTKSLALAIPVVVFVLAILAWWLTAGVLRPVEQIRAEVADITATELHRRVLQPRGEDEISRLARTMNAMLERVQHATDRQRQFVADASHELRSPLTRLRTALEVALAHPETTSPRETISEALHDTGALQHLVDDLLFLARSEAGADQPSDAEVDLDDLVLAAARRLRARCGLAVDVSAVSAARVRGDARQLARAIDNVVDNAQRHATSTVAFELTERDGRSELVISDDGPGVAEGDRQRVFTRFTRLDMSRSRDSGGSGLGLAIVHDIVTRHHGTVEFDVNSHGGARIVMSFPSRG